MTISEYIPKARSFAVFPPEMRNEYVLSLCLEECGEFIKPISKAIRKGEITKVEDIGEEVREQIKLELGDIAWCVANAIDSLALLRLSPQPEEPLDALLNIPQGLVSLAIGLMSCPFANIEQKNTVISTSFAVLSSIAKTLGYTLSEVLEANIAKLEARKERGTIIGEGDNR